MGEFAWSLQSTEALRLPPMGDVRQQDPWRERHDQAGGGSEEESNINPLFFFHTIAYSKSRETRLNSRNDSP